MAEARVRVYELTMVQPTGSCAASTARMETTAAIISRGLLARSELTPGLLRRRQMRRHTNASCSTLTAGSSSALRPLSAERSAATRPVDENVVVRRAPRWRRARLALEARHAEPLRRVPHEVVPPRRGQLGPLLADLGNKRCRRRVHAEGAPLRAHTATVVVAAL
jgi:hypothetical protein